MDSFSHEILSATRSYRFSFHQIKTPLGTKFFVECNSLGKSPTSFTMEKRDNEWKIIDAPKINDDILYLQPRLSQVLMRHL